MKYEPVFTGWAGNRTSHCPTVATRKTGQEAWRLIPVLGEGNCHEFKYCICERRWSRGSERETQSTLTNTIDGSISKETNVKEYAAR